MPLKPSGQTPTSSPPRSIRSASSLHARVAPPLRASALTNGIWKTRSAPSGRRKRPVWSWTASIVISPSTGWCRSGWPRPARRRRRGCSRAPRTSMRNHFWRSGAARSGGTLGDLVVEAVLVDRVVTGRAGGAGTPATRRAGAPSLAEDLLGRVLEGGEPVADRDAGRAGRARSVVAAARAWRPRRRSTAATSAGWLLGACRRGGLRPAAAWRRASGGGRLGGCRGRREAARGAEGRACRCRGRGGRGSRSG